MAKWDSDITRIFTNTFPPGKSTGILVFPFDSLYFPHILHAAIRHSDQPDTVSRDPHVHNVYHIVLVTGGRGSFLVDGVTYPVLPGDLFLTGPGQYHTFHNDFGETTEYCEVTFEIRDAQQQVLTWSFHRVLSEWLNKPCDQPITQTKASQDLYLLLTGEIEQIVNIGMSYEQDAELYITACLSRILLGLYTHLFRECSSSLEKTSMQNIRDYLHRHYNKQITLAELSKLAGLTPNYLSRRFRREFGITPIAYQHQIRIQTACMLLRTTEHSIKWIADNVGFGDIYYFSRMFKKIQGLPPGLYRKG